MEKPEYENPEWCIYAWGLQCKQNGRTLLEADLTQETFDEIYEDDFYDDLCWCDAFDRATGAHGERLKGIDGLFAKIQEEGRKFVLPKKHGESE